MWLVILSRSDNVHADAIAHHSRPYASVTRINFDLSSSDSGKFPLVTHGNATIRKSPDAIFVHQPRVDYREQWFGDQIEQKLFTASWESAKEWMESEFPEALWVNRPSANRRSRNILRQLRIASKLGLKTPPTLFTNDLEEVRSFYANTPIVIKQGNLGVHLEGKRILTSPIDVTLIDWKDLRSCPCLFQQYVPKRYELRVHVIGETILTCKIESQANDKTKVDWRNYDLDNTPHETYDLDPSIGRKYVEVVKQMDLEFGVIDLIVTPENTCVFLECNAQGHWIWIEKLTGLPITKTLCGHLLRGSI